MTSFAGHCHCGNIAVTFETARDAGALPIRACACAFCRLHGMRAVSDPEGHATITIHDPNRVNRYRFGLKTADFLICSECGVYVAAILDDGSGAWATLNVNTFDHASTFGEDAAAVNFDGESVEARRARRRENWTPATLLAQPA